MAFVFLYLVTQFLNNKLEIAKKKKKKKKKTLYGNINIELFFNINKCVAFACLFIR